MELKLTPDLFVNNEYQITYGMDKEALFIINSITLNDNMYTSVVNKIVITTRTNNGNGTYANTRIQGSVIGFGNNIVGTQTSDASLRGKVLSKDNMESVTIILYE